MLTTFPEPRLQLSFTGRIDSIDFTNDGSLLAVSQAFNRLAPTIFVYRVADGSCVASYGHEDEAGLDGLRCGYGARFMDGGQTLWYQVLAGRLALLYRVAAGGEPERVGEHTSQLGRSLMRDREGRRLAILGPNTEIWDLDVGGPVALLKGHDEIGSGRVQVAFADEGPGIYVLGRDPGRLVLHDLSTRQDLRSWEVPIPDGDHVAVSRSGRYFTVQGGRGGYLFDGERQIYPKVFRQLSSHYAQFPADESCVLYHSLSLSARTLPEDDSRERWGPFEISGRATCSAKAWDAEVYAWAVKDIHDRGTVLVYDLRDQGASDALAEAK